MIMLETRDNRNKQFNFVRSVYIAIVGFFERQAIFVLFEKRTVVVDYFGVEIVRGLKPPIYRAFGELTTKIPPCMFGKGMAYEF
jgi:hypothetical protein